MIASILGIGKKNNEARKYIIFALFFIAISFGLSFAVPGNGNMDARGGYITDIGISGYSNTDHWQGYSGVITTENSPIFYVNFNVSSPGISTIRRLELGASITEGDYLLITSSPFPFTLSELRPGNITRVDLITGTGLDSGSNTFVTNASYYVPGSGKTLTNVPTAYTLINSTQQFQHFKEGLLEDDTGTLIFVVPINATNETGYDRGKYHFQFILPNNFTNPLTYYMYYLPYSFGAVLPHSQSGGSELGLFDVVSVRFDKTTGQLDVIFRNNNNNGVFFRSHISLFAEGVKITEAGNDVIHYIEGKEESVLTYHIDPGNYIDIKKITVRITSEYGSSLSSISIPLFRVFDIPIITPKGNCTIEISEIAYDPLTQMLTLTLKNTGQIQCYGSAIITLFINKSIKTFNFENLISISSKDTVIISKKIELTEEDLAENPDILVRIQYGETPDRLQDITQTSMTLQEIRKKKENPPTFFEHYRIPAVILVILIIITIISVSVWRRIHKPE